MSSPSPPTTYLRTPQAKPYACEGVVWWKEQGSGSVDKVASDAEPGAGHEIDAKSKKRVKSADHTSPHSPRSPHARKLAGNIKFFRRVLLNQELMENVALFDGYYIGHDGLIIDLESPEDEKTDDLDPVSKAAVNTGDDLLDETVDGFIGPLTEILTIQIDWFFQRAQEERFREAVLAQWELAAQWELEAQADKAKMAARRAMKAHLFAPDSPCSPRRNFVKDVVKGMKEKLDKLVAVF